MHAGSGGLPVAGGVIYCGVILQWGQFAEMAFRGFAVFHNCGNVSFDLSGIQKLVNSALAVIKFRNRAFPPGRISKRLPAPPFPAVGIELLEQLPAPLHRPAL